MFTWLFFVAIAFAFLDWASTWKGWKIRLYIAKPATLLFLIFWTIQVTRWQGGMVWFGIALIFSLLGDIVLLLNPRYFLAGVGAFFFAHVAYLIGFNQHPAPLSVGLMILAVLVGVSSARVFRVLKPGLMKVPRGKRFLTAVFIYGATLTLMLLSTLITLFRADWMVAPAVFAASGGILFYISDTLLGYDRFVHKIKHGQSYVHLTYHVGQIGLITGAMLYHLK
ncbi:MAG: Uncharacterized protein FD147_2530 [Chloroflexi bacterium]|nr:MAG: Uncharacterized protein FD147_2530 [Chloroflexota bacterium]